VKPIPQEKDSGIRHDVDGRETLAGSHQHFESPDLALIQEQNWLQGEVQGANREPLRNHADFSKQPQTTAARAKRANPGAPGLPTAADGHPKAYTTPAEPERASAPRNAQRTAARKPPSTRNQADREQGKPATFENSEGLHPERAGSDREGVASAGN
jgi:hypothetical protein